MISNITSFDKVLRLLTENKIEFILIGGLAAIYHGSARLTQDVDVVYSRNSENLTRLFNALKPINPYLRDAPKNLPFIFDLETLKNGLNFTFVSDLGSIDLLGEVVGGGRYEDLIKNSIEIKMEENIFLCVNLEKLIELKRFAGRAKDLEAIAELELLKDS